MAAKSVYAGQLLYPGAMGEIGKLRTSGYLSKPAKQSVIGGVIKRIAGGFSHIKRA